MLRVSSRVSSLSRSSLLGRSELPLRRCTAAAAALPLPQLNNNTHTYNTCDKTTRAYIHISAVSSAASARSSSSSSSSAPSSTVDSSTQEVSFSSILSSGLSTALSQQGLEVPTPIQLSSLPILRTGIHTLLASHTGSGKTLAYLLPLIEHLRRDEELEGVQTRLARPRAIIIVPNRELAIQILSVGKSLSGSSAGRFRSLASTGFIPLRKLTRALSSPIDLLVVTPGRLDFLLSSNRIALTDVKYIVLDETDTLLAEDQGFREGLEASILAFAKFKEQEAKKLQGNKEEVRAEKKVESNGEEDGEDAVPVPSASRPPVQVVFCSASISSNIEGYIRRIFPNVHRVHTPSLHHLPESLLMKNIIVGSTDKREVLMDVLKKESSSYTKRLMHGRTREQNKIELAQFGGNQQAFIQSIVEQDVAKRLGLTNAADLSVKNQLRYEEGSQEDREILSEVERQSESTTTATTTVTTNVDGDDADLEDPDHPFHRGSSENDEFSSLPSPSSSTPQLHLPLPPTIIFCNTVSCCRAVAWYLTEQGLNVGHYHGLMPAHYRTMHFKNFLSGSTSILVSTDLGSRGLDTTFVQHVIHFDFPQAVVDFMHRVGRTARGGRKGKSTGLITKRDRVLSEAIERLTDRGLSIDQLSSDKSRYGPDGLPLSRPAAPADSTTSPRASSKSTSTVGARVLPPARLPKKERGLEPGSQPRRRWMRYTPPSVRNEHKLLYSYRPPPPSNGPTVGSMRREVEYGVTSSADAKDLLARQESPRRRSTIDPFAWTGTEQFRPNPSELRSQVDQRFADERAKKAEKARLKQQQSTNFPSAATSRRTNVTRPLGPLAHKQKVGAIFNTTSNKSNAKGHGKGGAHTGGKRFDTTKSNSKASSGKERERARNRANSNVRDRA